MMGVRMAETVSETWWYPLKWGDTLSNHEWMPLYVHRLLTSDFVAYACVEGRRADLGTALILWCESLRQNPAGTLPDDDVQLAQLARFGPDLAAWKAARDGALHGWESVIVDDAPVHGAARLGHRVIAPVVEDMFRRKQGRDQSRAAARLATIRTRVKVKMREVGFPKRVIENKHVVSAIADWLDRHGLYVTAENVSAGADAAAGVPRSVADLAEAREGRREG